MNSSLAPEAGCVGLGKFKRSSERADAELKMHALTLAAAGSLLGLGASCALARNTQARLESDFLSKAARLITGEKSNAHPVTVGLNCLF